MLTKLCHASHYCKRYVEDSCESNAIAEERIGMKQEAIRMSTGAKAACTKKSAGDQA